MSTEISIKTITPIDGATTISVTTGLKLIYFIKDLTDVGDYGADEYLKSNATADGTEWVALSDDPVIQQQRTDIDTLLDKPSTYKPTCDFEVVFNDGLELRSGYGNRNVHGNKAVDFSRANATENVNKSGVVESLAADEPAINNDGLLCFGSYNAVAIYSEDFTNASWGKTRLSAIDNGDGYFKIEITDASSFSRLRQLVSSSQGDLIVFAKEGNVSNASIRYEGGANSTTEIQLSSEPKEFRAFSDNSISNISIYPHSSGIAGGGLLGDFIYVKFVQCVSIKNAPYIKTTTAPAASSPTIPTVTMNGNMPRSGEEFTIVAGANIPDYASNGAVLSTSIQTTASGFVLRKNGLDALFFIGDGVTLINLNIPTVSGKSVIAISFDKSNIIAYVDGIEKARISASFVEYDVLSDLLIGRRTAGSELNSGVKFVEIYFSALTPEQIAARGSYNE